MKKIEKGIVFSNDIKRILNGINAFDYKYNFIPNDNIIDDIRLDFKKDVNKIFKNNVTIIKEDEMMEINNLITGGYPHCYSR
ncbi:MAG: hypothetical protein E7170_03105 [Firmicutes bacterium]|nr:hypothetical protein [Bacillota bacterium]